MRGQNLSPELWFGLNLAYLPGFASPRLAIDGDWWRSTQNFSFLIAHLWAAVSSAVVGCSENQDWENAARGLGCSMVTRSCMYKRTRADDSTVTVLYPWCTLVFYPVIVPCKIMYTLCTPLLVYTKNNEALEIWFKNQFLNICFCSNRLFSLLKYQVCCPVMESGCVMLTKLTPWFWPP